MFEVWGFGIMNAKRANGSPSATWPRRAGVVVVAGLVALGAGAAQAGERGSGAGRDPESRWRAKYGGGRVVSLQARESRRPAADAPPPGGGSIYGDLYVIERDGNGVPITKTFEVEGELIVCTQPLDVHCAFIPLMGDDPDYDPEVDDACDAQPEYADRLQEVTFGRQSVARAQAKVIDKSYYEALATFNEAAASGVADPYGLDPSGRMTLKLGEGIEKTIDAPLENLGLYRALMTTGCLPSVTIEHEPGVPLTMELSPEAKAKLAAAGFEDLVCRGPGEPITDLDMFRAAGYYAAAADKTDPVTVDEVIDINTYLGINKPIPDPRGARGSDEIFDWFEFEYQGEPYRYERAASHPHGEAPPDPRVLPHEAFILADAGSPMFETKMVSLFAGWPPGVDLPAVNVTVCRDGAPYQEPSGALRFCLSTDDRGGECGGANWFTQTAEDARKLVWFLHNWEVPEIAY
jgi:hypothetical protein